METKEGTKYAIVGGIVGNNIMKIENCYNIGKIIGKGSGYIHTGGIAGNAGTMKFCYYLNKSIESKTEEDNKNVNIKECVMQTEEQMKSDDFINLLNEELEEKEWKKDEKSINNGYPVLSWQ